MADLNGGARGRGARASHRRDRKRGDERDSPAPLHRGQRTRWRRTRSAGGGPDPGARDDSLSHPQDARVPPVGSDDDPVATTTVVVATGDRYRIEGTPESVEAAIIAASRGSIMQFTWLTEVGTGRAIAINPIQVVAVEAGER
jgi:hypothetical protein